MFKKFTILIAVLILLSTNAIAGFNFGVDTYTKVGDILIVNSLGDKVTESEFNYKDVKLGYNDYIPENAFKNNLYNEGYTVVYDGKQSGVDLVEVGYMGLKGNPRAYDVDYVLREEWEKYSSQYQDIRINENKKEINNIDVKHTDWNEYQDMRLDANKNNILINRNEINRVETEQTDWNNTQDTKINSNTNNITNNTNTINQNSNHISDVDNRVSDLEETQYRIDAEVQIYDGKDWGFSAFVNNDVRHSRVDAIGVKVTYKLGKDYAFKRMDELEKKIDMYIQLKEEEKVVVVPTQNGFSINNKF